MPDLFEPTHRLGEVRDEERLRLLLVIDPEAGSEHADREAERLGLTIQLAVARERRANRGDRV